MSPAADTLAYYAGWLEFRQRYLRVPAVQAAVWADGGVQLATSLGCEDGTLFRVASHSKTFTTVAVLQLVEEGRLRQDDRLGELLPELAASALAEVTVRELLSHSGGVIRDSLDGDFWQLGRPFPDIAELLAIAEAETAAVYPANETFKYTNIGFGLLGLIIERVTGAAYAERLADTVVHRLGMVKSGPELDHARADELATGYSSLAYSQERTPIEHVDTRALAAATGWFSTASELAGFYAALLPESDSLVSPNSSRQMRRPVWEITPGQQHYGLGLILAKVGERQTFGHSGGYPGHITRTMADADERIVVSVLTNAIDGPAEQLAAGWWHLLDLAGKATHEPAGDDEGRFTGRFASLWGAHDIALLDGRLFMINPTAINPRELAAPLERVDDATLRIVGGTGTGSVGELVRYTYASDGSVSSLRAGSGMTLTPYLSFSLPERVLAP